MHLLWYFCDECIIFLLANVSMHGSLFSLVGMVGSMYIMVSSGKCRMTCVSSNIVLYGASFVVHSLSGMV